MAERAGTGRDKLAAMQAEANRAKKRRTAIMLIGGLLVVILAVVATMALVSRNKDKPKPSANGGATYVEKMQHVPASMFDAVGKGDARDIATLKGTTATSGEKAKIVYYGGEYCPFCGIQRWAIVTALSRFGEWKGLAAATSSESNIPTVTFQKASYTSPYVTFTGYEIRDQQGNALMKPSTADEAIMTKYDTHEYFPQELPRPQDKGSIPFMTFGTDKASVGALFTADAMANASGDAIASQLSNADDDTTKGIIGAANVMSANICRQNGGKPASVCNSPGVKAAAAK